MNGLWGKKIGMTQVFVNNKVVPVTVLNFDNWFITGIKTEERDGYSAVQVGCLRKRYVGKPFSKEWLRKLRHYFGFIKEIRSNGSFKLGDKVDFSSVVSDNDFVDVFGFSKGCGFTGVVKRHGFSGGPAGHGSGIGRIPGSIGFMAKVGKVIKGQKLPGHFGNEKNMMANLKVIKIDRDESIILVKGSVPGKPGSLLFVRKRV